MRRVVGVAAVLAVTLACGKRSSEGQGAADSTAAVPPGAGVADSAAADSARADSIRADSVGSKAAARPGTKAPPPLTGYDSAFGPRFTVDSTGKVTPIEKKKP